VQGWGGGCCMSCTVGVPSRPQPGHIWMWLCMHCIYSDPSMGTLDLLDAANYAANVDGWLQPTQVSAFIHHHMAWTPADCRSLARPWWLDTGSPASEAAARKKTGEAEWTSGLRRWPAFTERPSAGDAAAAYSDYSLGLLADLVSDTDFPAHTAGLWMQAVSPTSHTPSASALTAMHDRVRRLAAADGASGFVLSTKSGPPKAVRGADLRSDDPSSGYLFQDTGGGHRKKWAEDLILSTLRSGRTVAVVGASPAQARVWSQQASRWRGVDAPAALAADAGRPQRAIRALSPGMVRTRSQGTTSAAALPRASDDLGRAGSCPPSAPGRVRPAAQPRSPTTPMDEREILLKIAVSPDGGSMWIVAPDASDTDEDSDAADNPTPPTVGTDTDEDSDATDSPTLPTVGTGSRRRAQSRRHLR
jgi:hypothetical protein